MSDISTLWSVAGRSVIGASHVRSRIPNQDAIAWLPRAGNAPTAVLTIADGHGAAPHFRSGTGAHMAVEVATAVFDRAARSTDLQAITREIITHWRDEVRADLAARPLRDLPTDDDDLFVPYGTTLIAASVSVDTLIVLQLGDGDLLVATSDGTMHRPLPDDEGLIGQQTYSLCQSAAERHVRARVLTLSDANIDFVMLATDGLSKSYAQRAMFTALAASWRRVILQDGLDAFMQGLDERLADISRAGSGDDVTVGFLVRASM